MVEGVLAKRYGRNEVRIAAHVVDHRGIRCDLPLAGGDPGLETAVAQGDLVLRQERVEMSLFVRSQFDRDLEHLVAG